MTIDENTRKARVVRWKAKKSVWDSKLANAANENDTAVAKAMLDQAESALARLGVNVPLVPEEDMNAKQKTEHIVKKIKKDRVSKSGVETAGTIGL